jgi:hypothetical protein
LKIILKRSSEDKYEVDQKPIVATPGLIKTQPPNRNFFIKDPPVEVEFKQNELHRVSEHEKQEIVLNQPKLILNHSKPFPIALVEDKENAVYTKALLYMHLFQTYTSPCVFCPWCKNFLSIGEFSKHIHVEDLSDSDDDSSSDLDDSDDDDDTERKKKKQQIKQEKKQGKYERLMKLSFKILPYCLNKAANNEASIKTWKMFGERFAHLKKCRQEFQQNEKKRLEEERLRAEERRLLEEKEEISESKKRKFECIMENKRLGSRSASDFSLSEDDSDKISDKISQQSGRNASKQPPNRQTPSPSSEFKGLTNELDQSVYLNMYKRKPTFIERFINLYDNLPKDLLFYICDNEFTIVPISFLTYFNFKREINMQNIKLAQTDYYRKLWFQMALDLDGC